MSLIFLDSLFSQAFLARYANRISSPLSCRIWWGRHLVASSRDTDWSPQRPAEARWTKRKLGTEVEGYNRFGWEGNRAQSAGLIKEQISSQASVPQLSLALGSILSRPRRRRDESTKSGRLRRGSGRNGCKDFRSPRPSVWYQPTKPTCQLPTANQPAGVRVLNSTQLNSTQRNATTTRLDSNRRGFRPTDRPPVTFQCPVAKVITDSDSKEAGLGLRRCCTALRLRAEVCVCVWLRLSRLRSSSWARARIYTVCF